jgi:hypothetical protein
MIAFSKIKKIDFSSIKTLQIYDIQDNINIIKCII